VDLAGLEGAWLLWSDGGCVFFCQHAGTGIVRGMPGSLPAVSISRAVAPASETVRIVALSQPRATVQRQNGVREKYLFRTAIDVS
jgi:hypothetical protein